MVVWLCFCGGVFVLVVFCDFVVVWLCLSVCVFVFLCLCVVCVL